jgi:hypothetical protein
VPIVPPGPFCSKALRCHCGFGKVTNGFGEDTHGLACHVLKCEPEHMVTIFSVRIFFESMDTA